MGMSTEQTLREFVIRNFYVSDPSEIRDDTSLVTGGYVDSTGVLEVIAFVEEKFGIRITDQETTPENLDSIARIASFIARKRAEAAA
jgi:acyl carrier protein